MKAVVSLIIKVGCLLILGNLQIQGQEIDVSNGVADPVKFDFYGDLYFKEERSHLDIVALQLKEQSSWIVNFDIYAGRRSCMGDAQARGVRAKKYLVSQHGITPDRIIWRDGGYRDQFQVEVWMKPHEAQSFPLMPTIKRGEAQIMKDCEKKYRQKRSNSSNAHD
jgi:hypothetical protein